MSPGHVSSEEACAPTIARTMERAKIDANASANTPRTGGPLPGVGPATAHLSSQGIFPNRCSDISDVSSV